MAMVRTGLADRLITPGRVNNPITEIGRRAASLRRWWLDYCTREGLRLADDRIVYEAGCRRTETGRIVPLNRR